MLYELIAMEKQFIYVWSYVGDYKHGKLNGKAESSDFLHHNLASERSVIVH